MLETDGEARLAQALGIAYRYLNRRERTEAEMRAHLEAKGVESPALEQTVQTLVEEGLVDDARYARLFTQDKRALEDWGSERIRRTLRARGIEREEIEAALGMGSSGSGSGDGASDGSEDGDGEVERAVALLRRRFPVPPDGVRERERALAVLLRKGYESEVALEALARRESEDGC